MAIFGTTIERTSTRFQHPGASEPVAAGMPTHEPRGGAEARTSAAVALDWTAIYARLKRDPNDAAAFAALAGQVRRWAERQIRSVSPLLEAHREDVVADTCAAALIGIDAAYGCETFPGFVYGHYLNARRRALQHLQRPVVPLGAYDPPAPANRGLSSDELALLERCLGELPRRERCAVELRYFDGASAREIGSVLSVTEGNARRLVFNGLARLRRTWPRSGASPRP